MQLSTNPTNPVDTTAPALDTCARYQVSVTLPGKATRIVDVWASRWWRRRRLTLFEAYSQVFHRLAPNSRFALIERRLDMA